MADPNKPDNPPASASTPARAAGGPMYPEDDYRRGPWGGNDGFGGWIWHILGGGMTVILILYTLLMRCWCVCQSVKCDDHHKNGNSGNHGNGNGNGGSNGRNGAPAAVPDEADDIAAAAIAETVDYIRKSCFDPEKLKKW